MLTERGGPLSVACLRWLVDGDRSALRPPFRVDVRVPAPGDPTPFSGRTPTAGTAPVNTRRERGARPTLDGLAGPR
jgi:hypothetical protein